MKVYDGKSGELVVESPVRDPEELARQALADLARKEPTNAVQQDLANLAPVSLELEAVRRYSACGSLAQVSREMGIAIYELQKLQRTQWWQDELGALRREETAIKNVKLARIHNMALDQLEDRLAHGDLVARGSGFVRQKLSGRDLARITEAVFKQRQLLLGEPTEISASAKKIESLADKLRAIGSKDPAAARRILEAEAVDVKATVLAPRDSTARDAELQRGEVESVTEGDA